MKLVIAEKPSVARDIAAAIGANENIDGVHRGNDYMVSSVAGHFVRLKEPQEYDEALAKWNIEDLPIVPDFSFTVIDGKEDSFDIIKELMLSDEVDSIICATDAGREGECIFRYIYNYIGCTKPFERLWISSLTPESIRNGFNNLLPSSDKDGLYAAGLTRNKVDWLFGMNLSRLYSIYYQARCSIGRVQTAVVNMIVQRDEEIANFIKKPYYKLKLANGAEWFDDEQDSFAEKSQAEAMKAKCENQICKVKSVDTKLKKENRPLLFSLTSLQVEANDKLSFSAARTLTVMQSLYEKKLLTYPRTDSNYITEDMAATLEELVGKLRFFNEAAVDELLLIGLNIDSRLVNNKKVTDHHAIIPTENIAAAEDAELTSDERAILEMVITRFMAVLSQEYQYNETSYIFDINGNTFRCKSKEPVQLGWKKFYSADKDDDSEDDTTITASYAQGEVFEATGLTISECETQPPKHYTESTLLKAMEHIDRRIDDKELSSYVKERGLGTPATRASIIERVITVEYIERKGKTLVSTEKGKQIIAELPDAVKDIEMTANMEQQLAGIEDGTVLPDKVIEDIIRTLNNTIAIEQQREHKSMAAPKPVLGKCPKCGGNVYEGKTKDGNIVYYCENNPKSCIFRLWKDDFFFTSKKKTLGVATVKALLSKGKVKVCGLYSKQKDKTYDAIISFADRKDLNGNPRIGFSMEFDNSSKSKKKK